MINRNEIIRRADDDGVPAATVERDYILSHVLVAIADLKEAVGISLRAGRTAARGSATIDSKAAAPYGQTTCTARSRPIAAAIRRRSSGSLVTIRSSRTSAVTTTAASSRSLLSLAASAAPADLA